MELRIVNTCTEGDPERGRRPGDARTRRASPGLLLVQPDLGLHAPELDVINVDLSGSSALDARALAIASSSFRLLMYFSNAATISAFPAPVLRSVSSLRRPHREKDGSAILILRILGQLMQHGQGFVDQGELLPGKGPVGRHVRHGGARPRRLSGEERPWPVPALARARAVGVPGRRPRRSRGSGPLRRRPAVSALQATSSGSLLRQER